jgi:hypothetical protein
MSSFRLINAFKNAEAPVNVIYSQWLGYLDGTHAEYFGSDEISAFRSDPAVNFIYAHSSGHAPLKDLQKLAAALKPKMLVPIHTEDADGFRSQFENVTTLKDGETFVLDRQPLSENDMPKDDVGPDSFTIGQQVTWWTGRGSCGKGQITKIEGDRIFVQPTEDSIKGSDYRVKDDGSIFWTPISTGLTASHINTEPRIWYTNS